MTSLNFDITRRMLDLVLCLVVLSATALRVDAQDPEKLGAPQPTDRPAEQQREVERLVRLTDVWSRLPAELKDDLKRRAIEPRKQFEDPAVQAWLRTEQDRITLEELAYFKNHPDDPLLSGKGREDRDLARSKALAFAALDSYGLAPSSSVRWDCVALAYEEVTRYISLRHRSVAGSARSTQDYIALKRGIEATDPFLSSSQYRKIVELAREALESKDIAPVTHANLAATKIKRIREVEFTNYVDSVRLKASPEEIARLRKEVKNLLGSIEQRASESDAEILAKRYGRWSMDDAYRSGFSYYASMLERPADEAEAQHEFRRIKNGSFPAAAKRAQHYLDRMERAKQLAAQPATIGKSTFGSALLGMLIPGGAEWTYLDLGVEPPATWMQLGSSLEGWKTGKAQLGYGDGDEVTILSFGSDAKKKPPVYYFRKDFDVPAEMTGKVCTITLRCDDGGVVYINGLEVGRANLPSGPITHQTFASYAIQEQVDTDITVPAGLLKAGLNVIAASIHQQSPTSSDLSFDLQLAVGVPEKAFAEAPDSTMQVEVHGEPDAPYLMKVREAGWEAWITEVVEGKLKKRVDTVRVGETVTVRAAAGRPAFNVTLREPAVVEPDETTSNANEPIFVMADSHGEYDICTELLIKQGVIDSSLNWSFGKGTFVITGDIFDRGPQQTEILWLLYKLEAEAQAAGGRVHLLLGNHETMVLTNDVRYLNPRYADTAVVLGVKSYADLWAKETLLGQWLRSKATVLKLDDTLFMHGGISIGTVDQKLSLTAMNQIVRDWLNSAESQDSGRLAFVKGSNGPLWYRGLVKKDARPEDITAIREFYSVNRLAVGHTVVDTVTPLYNGAVIAVQVYPTKKGSQMIMEGVYIDESSIWHRAKIDGTREILRDDEGNPIKNRAAVSATDHKSETKSESDSD